MKKIIVLMLLAMCAFNVTAQTIEQIRSKADAGDAYSQYLMGWSYANGSNGVKADYSQALPWFKKAGANGFAAAAYFAGWMYYYGEGVPQNLSEALSWFQKATDLGMSEASQMVLACSKGGSATSKSLVIDSFNPKNPPILEVASNSVKFIDPSGNNAIDAGEECYIKFKVTNKGKGTARNCVASVLSADIINGLTLNSVNMQPLPAGTTKEIVIPINSSLDLKEGKVDLVVQVNEPHGLGSDPIQLAVATKQFVAPKLEIVDYAITSAGGH